jgi:hypothetical protein
MVGSVHRHILCGDSLSLRCVCYTITSQGNRISTQRAYKDVLIRAKPKMAVDLPKGSRNYGHLGLQLSSHQKQPRAPRTQRAYKDLLLRWLAEDLPSGYRNYRHLGLQLSSYQKQPRALSEEESQKEKKSIYVQKKYLIFPRASRIYNNKI